MGTPSGPRNDCERSRARGPPKWSERAVPVTTTLARKIDLAGARDPLGRPTILFEGRSIPRLAYWASGPDYPSQFQKSSRQKSTSWGTVRIDVVLSPVASAARRRSRS